MPSRYMWRPFSIVKLYNTYNVYNALKSYKMA